MTNLACSTNSLAPISGPSANHMSSLQTLVSKEITPTAHLKMDHLEAPPSMVATSYTVNSDTSPTPTPPPSPTQHDETYHSSEEEELLRPEFDTTHCLFCHVKSSDFDSNVSHMSKSHGFIVPEQQRLQVDLQTFYDYLDLIISGYSQCIYCGTERNNVWAARHHMVAKNHCKIDITNGDSEFREFYNWDTGTDKDTSFVQIDNTTLRLSSGKILSDRSVRPKHHNSRRSPEDTSPPRELTNGSASTGTRTQQTSSSGDQRIVSMDSNERHDVTFFNQLTQLRQTDRISLAHLPVSQQRAQLMIRQRQTDQVKRSQQSSEGRLGGKGNRTSVTHFVAHMPGKKSGAHYAKIWTP